MTTAAIHGSGFNTFADTYGAALAPGPEEQTETDADSDVVTEGAQQASLREKFESGTHSVNGASDFTNYATEPSLATMKAIANQQIDQGLAQSPSGYIYGFEDFFAGRSGPVTPDELLLWLEGHAQDINDQLRERMLNADMRNRLVEDLSTLKAQVTTGTHPELKAEGEALLAAYVGTPYEEAARKALDGVINNPDKEEFGATEAEKVSSEMQSVIDKLGKDDQMDMIYIQQLANRLNEQFGFGSAYLSKQHDTLMAIIGNVA